MYVCVCMRFFGVAFVRNLYGIPYSLVQKNREKKPNGKERKKQWQNTANEHTHTHSQFLFITLCVHWKLCANCVHCVNISVTAALQVHFKCRFVECQCLLFLWPLCASRESYIVIHWVLKHFVHSAKNQHSNSFCHSMHSFCRHSNTQTHTHIRSMKER